MNDREEFEAWADANLPGFTSRPYAYLAWQAATLAERERCAKAASETICDVHLPTGVRIYGTRAAAVIREGDDMNDEKAAREQLLADMRQRQIHKENRQSSIFIAEACRDAADEIERLTAERDALREEVQAWMTANAPGGWINNLRRIGERPPKAQKEKT